MMPAVLLGLTFLSAGINWLSVARGWKWGVYLSKPATMLLLLGWLVSSSNPSEQIFWFGLAILFSLIGDIFLMLPSERHFSRGIISFGLAHLAYIIGINQPIPQVSMLTLGLAFLVGISAMRVIRRIIQGMQEKGLENLRTPVTIYANVIVLLLLSALLTLYRQDWLTPAALLMSVGAVLFVTSDTTLGWNKFVAPVKQARLAIMVTYHLGQIALAAGAVIQFGI